MLCLKKTRNRILTFFGAFLLSLLFTSAFGSSSSFATTISCDFSVLPQNQFNQGNLLSDYCSGLDSLDSSSTWYYYGTIKFSNGYGSLYLKYTSNPNAPNTGCTGNYPTCQGKRVIEVDASYGGGSTTDFYHFIVNDNINDPVPFPQHFTYFYISQAPISALNLKISDNIEPLEPTSTLNITSNGTYNVASYGTAVVDVPDTIIYEDYHNDLVAINNSIMVCASVFLVIYFFYCIYRMFIRSFK